MTPTMYGPLIGILLALAWVVAGFGAMLGVALAGLVGYVVAKAVEGELDVDDLVERLRERRSSASSRPAGRRVR